MHPRIFIASSGESVAIAEEIRRAFTGLAQVTVWNKGITPSVTTIEALFRQIKTSDFAIFVFHPDDTTTIRGETLSTTRDNVIFELGLFAGALGRERCLTIIPTGHDIRIPTDLLGVCMPRYDPADLKTACSCLWNAITTSFKAMPLFVTRYLSAEGEGPNLAKVDLKRAYRFLLYMFRSEDFDTFRALDLAFHRWEEILGASLGASGQAASGQAINISSEIIKACTSLFSRGKCKLFRRILVIDSEMLRNAGSLHILSRLREIEEDWRLAWADLNVETRVLPWFKDRNPGTQSRIASLHDFAAFSSEHHRLAIVETTLTAPTDNSAVPECEIRTDAEQVDRLQDAFDRLWEVEAKPIREILHQWKEVPRRRVPPPATSPAIKAKEYFLQHHYDIRSPCAVIIEVGYFDARTYSDGDRFEHVDDALWLRDELRHMLHSVRDRILLDTFINDLAAPVCGYECAQSSLLRSSGDRDSTLSPWREMLMQNVQFADLREDWELYSMNSTRNRFAERLKKLLKQKCAGLSVGGVAAKDQYFAETDTGRIVVGHRGEKGGIVPRCSGLMAQHYFDLATTACNRIPLIEELWIFDFSRASEANAVRGGAAALPTLFGLKPGLRLKIVNAVYQRDTNSQGDLFSLTIP
ncbi:MAG: nucleotide-binding protein [Verrucomicrobia bacterium]|nr:nucleotide-binding protein [Verrucomicrobiota bacterium]